MQSKHESESLAVCNSSTRSGCALACSDTVCFNHSVKQCCCDHVLAAVSAHHACREMGYLSSMPGLLRTQANIQKPMARQKVANLGAALDTIYLLLAPLTSPAGHQVRPARLPCLPCFRQERLAPLDCTSLALPRLYKTIGNHV